MDCPSVEQIRAAEALTGAGAKMVIGHHPHVVQGIEMCRGGLVAYSLGNFIFDSFFSDCCWSIILSVNVIDGEVVDCSFTPIEIYRQHRPVLTRAERYKELAREVKRRCELLKTKSAVSEYQKRYEADLKARGAQVRKSLRQKLCRTMSDVKAIYWPQILFRPIQRRLGIW